MLLSSWLQRGRFLDRSPDFDMRALSHPIRDPFSDAFSDLITTMRNFDRDFGALRGYNNDNNQFVANFPRYEIDTADNKYKIMVDVPGVKAEDIQVEVEEDGKILHISGGRKLEKDGVVSESRFEKRFTINASVDSEQLTARLQHGVLLLEAPLLENADKPQTRLIPVNEGSADAHNNEGEETKFHPLEAAKNVAKKIAHKTKGLEVDTDATSELR
jgi:HSP20 family protein